MGAAASFPRNHESRHCLDRRVFASTGADPVRTRRDTDTKPSTGVVPVFSGRPSKISAIGRTATRSRRPAHPQNIADLEAPSEVHACGHDTKPPTRVSAPSFRPAAVRVVSAVSAYRGESRPAAHLRSISPYLLHRTPAGAHKAVRPAEELRSRSWGLGGDRRMGPGRH
jgi:hypothetical protein